MGGCVSHRGEAAEPGPLEASECELRLQTDDDDGLLVRRVRAYRLETAGALLARQAEWLGLPAGGLELEFSNELVPAECVLQEAGIMEVRALPAGPVLTGAGQGATVRVLGVPAMRRKLVRTDADIRAAVAAWLDDPVSAEAEYGHIAKWNVKAVTDMHELFRDAHSFNEDVSGWDVSSVKNMSYMFSEASSFNQDLSGWDVNLSLTVLSLECMFEGSKVGMFEGLDENLPTWFGGGYPKWYNTWCRRCEAMRLLAPKLVRTDADIRTAVKGWLDDSVSAEAEYGHIAWWNVKAVTTMEQLFMRESSFDDDLSGWDVSSVTNMRRMFDGASSFNQDVSGWDVSSVTNMGWMFHGASSFNQDVSGWDVSNVTDMGHMFYDAESFDKDLSSWGVTNVTNVKHMFRHASSFLLLLPPGRYTLGDFVEQPRRHQRHANARGKREGR